MQDAETGDWENADDVAPDAYQSVTGEDIPGDSSDLSGDPRGTPWDDEQAEAGAALPTARGAFPMTVAQMR